MGESKAGTRDWSKPVGVSDIEMAFPTNLDALLPSWEELPEDFRRNWHSGNKWCDAASTWFYHGVSPDSEFEPREGVDPKAAFRHLGVCLGSWEPKHEHKIAGVGYLMSLFFKSVDIKPAKK